MSIVSNNIKYLRRLNGLTQEQFAVKIGIKRSLLGAYEEARANPNLENLQTIAQLFGTSVDEIIKTDIQKNKLSQNQLSFIVTEASENKVPSSNETKSNDAYNQEIDRLLHNIEQNEAVFTENNLVSIVKKNQSAEYLSKRLQSGFINSLDKMTLPNLDNHKTYRAFEANEEFNFENALLIGELLFDTNEMIDGKNYLLVSSNHGIMYRRIFNQLRTRGTILLSSDNINIPTVELKAKEIIEIWQIIAFLSYQMPKPQASLSAIKQLVNELQDELKRT